MNKKSLLKVFVLVSAIGMGIVACQKDDSPGGGGNSSDRDKFLGTWKVSARDQAGPYNFQMTINTATSPDQVLIDNFDGQNGKNTRASISGNNISFPEQIISTSGDTILGSGTYSSGNLSLHYTVRDGITTADVTATATR